MGQTDIRQDKCRTGATCLQNVDLYAFRGSREVGLDDTDSVLVAEGVLDLDIVCVLPGTLFL